MNQTEVNHEQIAEWRKLRGKGMVSAVGEYTPDEFWLLLDNFERLERDLAKANADKAVLIAACKAALSLAWEVGCETEDGVHTLLDDSRGDLYRKLSAALSQVQAHEDEGVCPYCNKSCATVVDVALHVQAQHAHEA